MPTFLVVALIVVGSAILLVGFCWLFYWACTDVGKSLYYLRNDIPARPREQSDRIPTDRDGYRQVGD